MIKPPMAVWADDEDCNSDWIEARTPRYHGCNHCYVHLDQFLAEVEKRATECAEEGLNFDVAFTDAVRDLAKEIKGE